jgi:1-acyl-sn-glycerol-3-phosphate acyltransferase
MHPATAALYGLGYTLLMSRRALGQARRSESSDAVCAVALQWADTLCQRCSVRVVAENAESIDWNQSLVVAANHQSLFDIPVLLTALGRAFGFLTKRELFCIPAFGQAISRLGCVSIDRSDRASASEVITAAAQRLREGASLVVFPEGTRSADGELGPFKKGPFYLIQEAEVPVIPVALIGTRLVLRKHGVLVNPAEVIVRVGEPIRCTDQTPAAREELRTGVRSAMLGLMKP